MTILCPEADQNTTHVYSLLIEDCHGGLGNIVLLVDSVNLWPSCSNDANELVVEGAVARFNEVLQAVMFKN